MQPSPVAIIVRNNKTSEFQETTGLLYCLRQGDNMIYTAIIERENIDRAGTQVLNNDISPLQLILQQQEKTRKKAEQIADKIIEEIILQKSKQQLAQKMLTEQHREIALLAEDINNNNSHNPSSNMNIILPQQLQQKQSMQQQQQQQQQYYLGLAESRSMTGLQRDGSMSSLDQFMKKSNSQNLITINQNQQNNVGNNTYSRYNPNGISYVQRKNELIQKIGSQIERNIKDEQQKIGERSYNFYREESNNNGQNNYNNNIPSAENISVSNRITPRSTNAAALGGSPKLIELRNINKSRNQSASASPQKQTINLNKVNNQQMMNPDDRLETDFSLTSNNNTNNNNNGMYNQQLPLLDLQQNNTNSNGQNDNNNQNNPNNQFDLKEYMKQAILGQSKPSQQQQQHRNYQNVSEGAEQTPAFHMQLQNHLQQTQNSTENNNNKTASKFISSLSYIDNQVSQKEIIPQQPSRRISQEQYINNLNQGNNNSPSASIRGQDYQAEGSYNNGSNNQGNIGGSLAGSMSEKKLLTMTKSPSSKIGLTQRNVERDKLKKANAEIETRSSQFKQQAVSASPKEGFNNLRQSEESLQTNQSAAAGENSKNNKIAEPSSTNGGTQSISDFISKINIMLQKSANINAQVERSMIDSEKNLQQLEQFQGNQNNNRNNKGRQQK